MRSIRSQPFSLKLSTILFVERNHFFILLLHIFHQKIWRESLKGIWTFEKKTMTRIWSRRDVNSFFFFLLLKKRWSINEKMVRAIVTKLIFKLFLQHGKRRELIKWDNPKWEIQSSNWKPTIWSILHCYETFPTAYEKSGIQVWGERVRERPTFLGNGKLAFKRC